MKALIPRELGRDPGVSSTNTMQLLPILIWKGLCAALPRSCTGSHVTIPELVPTLWVTRDHFCWLPPVDTNVSIF